MQFEGRRKITKVSLQPLKAGHRLALARAIMNDKQAAAFKRSKECNFAISPAGVGRFRVNAFTLEEAVERSQPFRRPYEGSAFERSWRSPLG